MKLTALCAGVALMLTLASPARADDPNHDFVKLLTISYVVTNQCKGYAPSADGMQRWADSHGVEASTVVLAALNAIEAIAGRDYERDKLIPAVTQTTRAVVTILSSDLRSLGPQMFCATYAPGSLASGIVKRSQ